MELETVLYRVEGNVGIVSLNRTKALNAMSKQIFADLTTALLLAGDIALVSDDAMFMVAFGAVGLIPDCAGHWLLPRACGLNMAKELMMTQRAVKAPEMKELGLCNHVYPKDQLMDEAMKLANKIAKGPLNCYSSSKLIMNKSFETNLDALLQEETEAQAAARLHANGDEGLAAFLEKRKANFQ